MLTSFAALLALVGITLAAFGLGRWVLRALQIEGDEPLETCVLSMALGLFAWGLLTLALGRCGWLQPEVFVVATIAAAAWGGVELLLLWAGWLERGVRPSAGVRSSRLVWMAAAGGVAAAVLLIEGLLPPTGAGLSHLELPKRWIVDGRIWLPDDAAGLWMLPQAWSAWALMLADGEAARLIGWLTAALLAGATALLAAPLMGRPAGWGAAALVVLSPGVLQRVLAVDPVIPAVACSTLAAAAWWRATVESRGLPWAVAAGLVVGMSFGQVALPGLLLVMLLMLSLASISWGEPERRGELGRHVLAATAAAALAASVLTLLRPTCDGGLALADASVAGPRDVFGVSMLIVALLPGLIFARRLGGLRPMLVAAAAYALLTAPVLTRAEVYLPLVPLSAVAAVWVWLESRRLPLWPRRLVSGAIGMGALATLALPLMQLPDALAVASGWRDREAYLAERAPEWRAAAVVNRVLGPRSHVLSQAERTFYFDRRVTSSVAYWRSTAVGDSTPGPSRLAAKLRAAGFSHLLLVEPAGGNRDDELLAAMEWQTRVRPTAFIALTEYESTAPDGRPRRYRLLKLERAEEE